MIPGEYRIQSGNIALNVGRETRSVIVENHGDRPIQVGSHYHFYEVNPALNSIAKPPEATDSTSLPALPCASSPARSGKWRWCR